MLLLSVVFSTLIFAFSAPVLTKSLRNFSEFPLLAILSAMSAFTNVLWTMYRWALRFNPQHPIALTLRAEDALGKKAWGRAFDLSHQALARRDDFAPALFVRGVARLHLDDYRGALFDFNQYLAAVEQPPSIVYYWRARLYISRDEWTLAQRDIERVLPLNHQNPQILYWYAFVLWRRREWEKLEKTLSALERFAPTSCGLWELRGHAWLSQGNDFLAEKAYTRAIRFGLTTPDIYYNRAVARRHLGLLDKARRDVQAIFATDPNNAWAHVEMSTLAFTIGDYELAHQHAKRAKQQVPNLFEAHFCVAASLAALGYRSEACKLLEEMRDRFPNQPKADVLLGDLLAEEGQSAAAADLYEAVLQIDPENRDVQLKLAEEWLALDRFDTAEELLNSLHLEDPHCTDTLSLRVDLYRHTNRPDAMRRDLEILLRLDPHNAPAFTYRAMYRCFVGDAKGAKADLDKALAVESGEGWIWAYRGQWYLRDLNLRAARDDFQKAITLAPENGWIRRQWAIFLIQSGHLTKAGYVLDALIHDDPEDGYSRLVRAELYLMIGEWESARQQCAAIVANHHDTVWLAHTILAVLAVDPHQRTLHLKQAEQLCPAPAFWGVSIVTVLGQQSLLQWLRGDHKAAEQTLQQALKACQPGELLWRALPPLFSLLNAHTLTEISTPLAIPLYSI